MATFTNQATLSYNDVTLFSNVTTAELVDMLSIDETAVISDYTGSDTLTYVISLVNGGETAMTDLTVTDDLGGYLFDGAMLYPLSYVDGSVQYFVDGVLQAAPAVTAGPALVFSGISVPAGGSALLVYQADVTAFAPLGSGDSIVNTATVSGGNLCQDVTASATVYAADGFVLALLKDVTPDRVTCADQLTYTMTARNSGNAAAESGDGLVIRDTFDPILSGLSVTFNGASWTEGNQYTYDETTGEFATVAGQVTVPAATFTQDPITGAYTTVPGDSVLSVTGTV